MDSSPSEKKGTLTPLSSLFPVEEAQKASMLVQEAIAEHQQQLDRLKGFINDNADLITLVQKLGDEINHHIMVPFGKAAFFPGRLIHTNEFMVLLGEGHYVERTSKQTTEILKRRGKGLETQIRSLEAVMQDLKAETSFFDATAYEAAEGLVDIREDYTEESSRDQLATAGYGKHDTACFVKENDPKSTVEDDEYERIFSRIAELEKEEEEAEKANEYDEDEQIENELHNRVSQASIDKLQSSMVDASDKSASSKDFDGSIHGNFPSIDNNNMSSNSEVPEIKERVQVPVEVSEIKEKAQAPVPASGMAFTGSIVEHAPDFGMNRTTQQIGSQSSKPMSRFRLQRK